MGQVAGLATAEFIVESHVRGCNKNLVRLSKKENKVGLPQSVSDIIRSMTNIETLIAAVQDVLANENATRYGGKTQLQIDAPKLEIYEFQNRPRIQWHSGIPNSFCAFSFSFDNDHCAAYVYVWDQPFSLNCTLRVSNIDGAHYAALPPVSKSRDDYEIARHLIDMLVAGTECTKSRGPIKQFVEPEGGRLGCHVQWYSNGGL